MATRARKAAANTPAKNTTTKKATTRAPRKRTAKKTTPALTLVQPTGKDTGTATQVDTRPRLAVRRRPFVGPMGPNEQAAIRAALDSAALRLPVPVRTWNGSTANLTDGTLLIHNPSPDRVFTAHIACRRGSIHGYPITSADDLKTARAVTRACERRHTDNTPADDGAELNWHKALGHGIQPTSRLGEGLQAVKKTVADTQPLSTDEIAAHIAEQLAADQPKEHPQP